MQYIHPIYTFYNTHTHTDTQMQKIMDAYAARKGIQSNALRFTLDGDRIKSGDTPKMLELEENDQIDVMLEVVGGSF